MKIELKNIKHAAFASEETYCFQAALYINGKKRGGVSNDGRGGPTHFDDHDAEREIDAYAKTLPPVTYQSFDQSNSMTIEQDAEWIVNGLLEDYLILRDMTKALRSRVLFVEDGKVWQTKPCASAVLAANIKHYADKGLKVLNTLPKAEALALYRGAA